MVPHRLLAGRGCVADLNVGLLIGQLGGLTCDFVGNTGSAAERSKNQLHNLISGTFVSLSIKWGTCPRESR